ncbi:MAG: cupin-like domain-containing protein [Paracoccaceae bacterium]
MPKDTLVDAQILDQDQHTLFSCDTAAFRRNFTKLPFELQHNFADSELFTLPRLARAAEQLIDQGRGHRFMARRGQHDIGAGWGSMPTVKRVATAIESIGEQEAWVKVSALNEADPVYVEFLDTAIDEIEARMDQPFRETITHAQMTAFISSPGVAAPYHIDHEENFLCQVYGTKDVCVYDPSSRENLPDAEIERFYFGNLDAATYREDMSHHGKVFHLKPGVAVHHPSLAGHWVRNGDEPSVSVSLVFCTKEIDRRAYTYQSNFLLRKLGLRQRTPGRSPFWDGAKAGAIQAISKRNPKSYNELILSGPSRIKAPARMVKRLVKGA